MKPAQLPFRLLITGALLLLSSTLLADTPAEIQHLQTRWAEISYNLEGEAQASAFEALIEEAAVAVDRYPDSAPAWIWSGIIKSTYAGVAGPMAALKMAKSAKSDLERALDLDPEAMEGSAYTSLGALYYRVPGWPIGFGNDKRAGELLRKALAINPDSIDSNYFYGDYLFSEKRYDEAERYLLRAQNSPARPDRALADEGRQRDIQLALANVRKKLAP